MQTNSQISRIHDDAHWEPRPPGAVRPRVASQLRETVTPDRMLTHGGSDAVGNYATLGTPASAIAISSAGYS
jgi:hypothetical protein